MISTRATEEFSEVFGCSTKHSFPDHFMFDAVHRIFFEDREKNLSWVGVPFLWLFSACEIEG